MGGHRDLARVAAEVRAVPVQYIQFVVEDVDIAAAEVPVLGESGGGTQRALLARAADADRRVRFLDRLGLAARVGGRVVLAGEVGPFLGQQVDDCLAGFLEPVAALLPAAPFAAVRGR